MKARCFLSIAFTVSVLAATSCSTSKKTASDVKQGVSTERNLEGEKVQVETLKMSGIEMTQTLNEDGTGMVEIPYKWYAGIGKADNKQVAIELAQREAYATISRMLSNAVLDKANRGERGAERESPAGLEHVLGTGQHLVAERMRAFRKCYGRIQQGDRYV